MTTVLEAAPTRTVSRPWPAPVLAGGVLLWITLVLSLDAHASLALQRLLGLVTWGCLALVLRRESSLVRVQALIVVAVASLVEYTFSPLMEVYLYRFHNVPAYVPPGHGLVYLAALAIGRSIWVRSHTTVLTWAVVVTGGCWAAYGAFLADRTDALGAFWFLCLLGFLRWGPSRGLYVGAFLVVSYLELLGTSLGNWAWQPSDPTGIVAIGNPPSGAAGGYGWFDLVAIMLAPTLLRRLRVLGDVVRRQQASWAGRPASFSPRPGTPAPPPSADAEP